MVGKLVYPIFIMLVLTPVWYTQTKSAGQMTAKTVFEPACYIIKRIPGEHLKSYSIPRTVSATNGREAKIQNGCKSLPASTRYYTDYGVDQNKKIQPTNSKVPKTLRALSPLKNLRAFYFAYQTMFESLKMQIAKNDNCRTIDKPKLLILEEQSSVMEPFPNLIYW